MDEISGRALTTAGQGIAGLLVSAYAVTGSESRPPERRRRLGSTPTATNGNFRLAYANSESVNLEVAVEADGAVLAVERRDDVAGREVFRFRLAPDRLQAAG